MRAKSGLILSIPFRGGQPELSGIASDCIRQSRAPAHQTLARPSASVRPGDLPSSPPQSASTPWGSSCLSSTQFPAQNHHLVPVNTMQLTNTLGRVHTNACKLANGRPPCLRPATTSLWHIRCRRGPTTTTDRRSSMFHNPSDEGRLAPHLRGDDMFVDSSSADYAPDVD